MSQTLQESPMNLSEHLEELRRKLIICAASIAILSAISFLFSDFLIEIISAPIMNHIYTLYFLSPYEAFVTKLKISIVTGVLISLPVIFTQLWLFVAPGLRTREQQVILPLALSSTLLFLIGGLFAYFAVIPFVLNFFLGFQSSALSPLISIGSYVSFFLSFILVFGIVFDLPIVLVGLIWLGVVEASFLACQRKWAVLSIFILAAVLTPTIDMLTQCLLAIPLWGFYELSILIGREIEKRRGETSKVRTEVS
ncbi:MAG: twin arginine-targeting protein translocase TatC [Omnitrophica bacterium RIFCSPHIGHO2_02_FULL_46_11]|nr:MAG: twin arginine-targeting protein translocase TatC [Omnitrophica bacterium RIFCSPLOWO2_01_FULL_45_10b]OGW86109.1 MAG: twin arginine-targeting protein translocase TatC [Omnitrophica bacterium RIFCSPHIGHO2_02_FULL_46_11]